MEPTDLYGLQAVSAVVVHPAGTSAAYTVAWPDQASDENRSQVWIYDIAGDSHRLLLDGHNELRPRFSPDGSRLALLRSEPKTPPTPVVVEIETGAVSEIEGFGQDGATAVEWVDNDRLVIAGAARPSDQDGIESEELAKRIRVFKTTDYRFNGKGWTHDRPGQIWTTSISSGTTTRLTNAERNYAGLAVSPDGSSLLSTTSVTADGDLTGENVVVHISLAESAASESGEQVLTQAGGRWAMVGWAASADGSVPIADRSVPIAVGSTRAGTVTLQHPHRLDPTGAAAPVRIGDADVSAASLVGDGGRMVDIGGSLLMPGVRRGTVTVDRYELDVSADAAVDGACSIVAETSGVIGSFDTSGDGSTILAAVSTPTRPAELWEFTSTGSRVIRSFNEELLATLDLAEPEIVQIPSTDGAEVEAFVVRPPASAPNLTNGGAAGPGLVYVHGGPMFAYGLAFFDEFQLAAAAGYTVIGGNPRGSDGYGEEWAATLRGRLGTIDAEDVTAITDHLASLPEVDSERIGLGGGSYGGFMTSWMIGHTDRYKAALVERAVTNWESFAGTSDIGPWFGPMLLDASVESDVEKLRHMSPLTYAPNVSTPTLIVHSEEDWRCPIEQAEQLFVAYRRNGVDVTFARVPGENHELTRNGSPQHRVDRFELVHEFFSRHV